MDSHQFIEKEMRIANKYGTSPSLIITEIKTNP